MSHRSPSIICDVDKQNPYLSSPASSSRDLIEGIKHAERQMPEIEMVSAETISAFLIVITILHVLAVILTSFRLWFRHHTRRLGWDDFWAALTLLFNVGNVTVIWLSFAPLNDPYINYEALPTPPQSRNVHVITAWLDAMFYTCSIWFSRMSILSSVGRIVPPNGSSRKAPVLSGILFLTLWAYMMVGKIAVCSADDSWHNAPIIQCPLPEWIAISEVCTDVVSDIILVALPLRLLWRVKLPSKQRIMVLSIFSMSMLVSVVSVVHTLYIIPAVTFIGPLTAELGAAVSLIVCNLLVIVTFIYRLMRTDIELTFAGKQTSSSHRLTTVDLDYHGTWFSDRLDTNTAITGTNVSSVEFVPPEDAPVVEEGFSMGMIGRKR